MVDKMFDGTVDYWKDTGTANGFGFLSYESGSRIDRIYFDHNGITPSSIGITQHAKIVGNLVRFRLSAHMHKGERKPKATAIESVFSTEITTLVEDHREISVIDHIVRGPKREVASVFLKRKSGDQLYLSHSNVAPEHRDRFHRLQIGQHVWHGVQRPTGSHLTWLATAGEFYSKGEEALLVSDC